MNKVEAALSKSSAPSASEPSQMYEDDEGSEPAGEATDERAALVGDALCEALGVTADGAAVARALKAAIKALR